MRVLKSDQFGIAEEPSVGLRDQGMALSVLSGVRPGVVVVNDATAPTSLFVGAPEGGFAWGYLAGDPQDDWFRRELRVWLFAERGLGQNVVFSFLACDSIAWEDALAEILAPRAVIPDRRLHYECTTRPGDWREAVPDGYEIEDLDQAFLASNVEVHPKVSEWMEANFGSVDGFLRHGVGAVGVHEGRVVSWILADSLVDGLCDIGGETEEAHQRKGLAHAATCRTVELALDRGVERVGWHCHVINLPSIRTAEKAGFELRYEYAVYPVQFDPEGHEKLVRIVAGEYAEAAGEALERKAYGEADALFTRMLGFVGGPEADVAIGAARAAAGVGDPDRAFEFLDHAIRVGWNRAGQTRTRPEFESLQQDARWERIMMKLDSA